MEASVWPLLWMRHEGYGPYIDAQGGVHRNDVSRRVADLAIKNGYKVDTEVRLGVRNGRGVRAGLLDMLLSDPSGRSATVPVEIVSQGEEKSRVTLWRVNVGAYEQRLREKATWLASQPMAPLVRIKTWELSPFPDGFGHVADAFGRVGVKLRIDSTDAQRLMRDPLMSGYVERDLNRFSEYMLRCGLDPSVLCATLLRAHAIWREAARESNASASAANAYLREECRKRPALEVALKNVRVCAPHHFVWQVCARWVNRLGIPMAQRYFGVQTHGGFIAWALWRAIRHRDEVRRVGTRRR
jgi:hypothetical protein